MCGIVGIIEKGGGKRSVIGAMNDRIVHRGPDDDGVFVDDFVALAMRRLSIIDLAGGKQPIFSDDKTKVIVFNGEIYNYLKLRAGLEAQGVRFVTHTDTEVILRLYEREGEQSVLKLRGMFAFSIYDSVAGTVFIARDFFGIKPLYYWQEKNAVRTFGSEIKSLLEHPEYKASVNEDAIASYLRFQYNQHSESFFAGIKKLAPGHSMQIDVKTGSFTIKQYWNFSFAQTKEGSEGERAGKLREVLADSVRHHMVSDVPVGSFLSGGIDSSAIASLMAEERKGEPIQTFTVGFEGLSEGKEARPTAEAIGSKHTEITVSADEYFGSLRKAVWHFDEPVADPSAIGLYFLAKEAVKHVKVVLSGEGADELFGGYNIYLEPYARARIAWVPKIILRGMLAGLRMVPGARGVHYIERALQSFEERYIGNASIFTANEITKLWKGNMPKLPSLHSLYQTAQENKWSEPTTMQYIDINTWLIGDILAKADKMTMAHSLELRVPFLDIAVANFARTLPDKLKFRPKWIGGTTKYLFRKAMESVIPEETRHRRKLGFPTPIRRWLKGRQEVRSQVLESAFLKKYLDMNVVTKLFENHENGKADNSRKIYALLMLALWREEFAGYLDK